MTAAVLTAGFACFRFAAAVLSARLTARRRWRWRSRRLRRGATRVFVVVMKTGRISACDGSVVGVGVAVPALRISSIEHWVDADESAHSWVVFAGADVGEAGRVGSPADEAFAAEAAGLGAAGSAVGHAAPTLAAQGGGVDGDGAGAVVVGDGPGEGVAGGEVSGGVDIGGADGDAAVVAGGSN